MTPEIRRRIHAFRNALVLAADTRSHECCGMKRWYQELNCFPRGCCNLASHFLAQYLKDSDKTLKPVIVSMATNADFCKNNEYSDIKSHVIVKLDGWLVDLTLNQFEAYHERVVIDGGNGPLYSLWRSIERAGGTVQESPDIQMNSGLDMDGSDLYEWLRATADSLLVPQ
jgi:hypothetical protein